MRCTHGNAYSINPDLVYEIVERELLNFCCLGHEVYPVIDSTTYCSEKNVSIWPLTGAYTTAQPAHIGMGQIPCHSISVVTDRLGTDLFGGDARRLQS